MKLNGPILFILPLSLLCVVATASADVIGERSLGDGGNCGTDWPSRSVDFDDCTDGCDDSKCEKECKVLQCKDRCQDKKGDCGKTRGPYSCSCEKCCCEKYDKKAILNNCKRLKKWSYPSDKDTGDTERDCDWCGGDKNEIVCWKGKAYEVCRNKARQCKYYGSDRFDWIPPGWKDGKKGPWKAVKKYRRASSWKNDWCDEDDADDAASYSCGKRVRKVCWPYPYALNCTFLTTL